MPGLALSPSLGSCPKGCGGLNSAVWKMFLIIKTEFSQSSRSLSFIPESISGRHLLRYWESLPEALPDNLFIREHSDIVTGQDRVGTSLEQQPALCSRPTAVGEDCVEDLDWVLKTLTADLLYFSPLKLRGDEVSEKSLSSVLISGG